MVSSEVLKVRFSLMPRRSQAISPGLSAEPDPLVAVVQRLADELRIFRDVIDGIREDISWVSRNGLPIQPIEHVVVRRMALDPCAPDWRDQLQLERSTFPVGQSDSSLDADTCDRIAEELKTTFEAVAQGQLEVVLTALDGVRAEILAALNRHGNPAAASDTRPTADEPTPPGPTVDQRRSPPGTGLLF